MESNIELTPFLTSTNVRVRLFSKQILEWEKLKVIFLIPLFKLNNPSFDYGPSINDYNYFLIYANFLNSPVKKDELYLEFFSINEFINIKFKGILIKLSVENIYLFDKYFNFIKMLYQRLDKKKILEFILENDNILKIKIGNMFILLFFNKEMNIVKITTLINGFYYSKEYINFDIALKEAITRINFK